MTKKHEPLLYLYKRNNSLDGFEESTASTASSSTGNGVHCNECNGFIFPSGNNTHNALLRDRCSNDSSRRSSNNDSIPIIFPSKRNRLLPSFSSKKKGFTSKHKILVESTTQTNETLSLPSAPEPSNEIVSVGQSLQFLPCSTIEERFARKLFFDRRCWSFMTKHQRLSIPVERSSLLLPTLQTNSNNTKSKELPVIPHFIPKIVCDCQCQCRQTSQSILLEIKANQDQNSVLQEKMIKMSDQLACIIKDKESDEEQESVSYLMTTILQAQKERESIMEQRLEAVTRDRDRISKQLNDLIEQITQLQFNGDAEGDNYILIDKQIEVNGWNGCVSTETKGEKTCPVVTACIPHNTNGNNKSQAVILHDVESR